MHVIAAISIDVPALLLQSNGESAGGGAGAWILPVAAGVLAAAALAVVVSRRLWRMPAEASGRLPRDPAVGALALMFALVAGSIAAVAAGGAGIEDPAYARLAAGVASNLAQAAVALFAIHSVLSRPGAGTPMPAARAAREGAVALVLAFPVIAAISLGVNALLVALGQPKAPDTSHETLQILVERRDALLTTLTLAHVAVLVAVSEEALWRGLLQPAMRCAGLGAAGAVAATAVLFTLIHWTVIPADGRIAGLAMLFVLACALGILRERTGGLVAPITLHALFNAANVAIALAQNPVSSTS